MKNKVINIDPLILGGTPVFSGTQVPVKDLFDFLSNGEGIEEFLEDNRSVKREQIIKLLEICGGLIESSPEIFDEESAE